MLVFRKVLRTYLMNDPYDNLGMHYKFKVRSSILFPTKINGFDYR